MNNHMVKMDDMTYSREMYEARAAPGIILFISTLSIMIIAAGIGCFFGEIEIVVKANGVIKPSEKVTRITNKVLGEVESVHYTDGQKVRQGDMLYSLQLEGIDQKRNFIVDELQKVKSEYDELIRMKSMMATAKTERVIAKQRDRLNRLIRDKNTTKRQFLIQCEQLTDQLSRITVKLQQLKTLQQSLAVGKNYFTDQNMYFYQYEEFKIKQKQLTLKVEQARENFMESVRLGEETEKAKKAVGEAKLSLDSYIKGFHFNISKEVEQTELQLAEHAKDLDMLVVEFNQTIQQKEASWKEWKEKLNEVDQNMREREGRAPVSGVVHVSKEINRGELLQPGEEILTIIPEHDTAFMIDMAVSNSDIASIQVGDSLQCEVTALPAQNYGHLTGRIQLISEDALIHPQTGASYYRVRAALFTKPLYNEQGKQAHIKNGMLAEAHILTRREKILYHVLDKLGLR